MANVTLTFAYSFPAEFGGEPQMQYKFINPITFESSPDANATIAKIFASSCLSLGYPELAQFAAALYNSTDATVTVDSSLIPNVLAVADALKMAGVFRIDPWKYDILVGIINSNG